MKCCLTEIFCQNNVFHSLGEIRSGKVDIEHTDTTWKDVHLRSMDTEHERKQWSDRCASHRKGKNLLRNETRNSSEKAKY